MLLLQYDHSRLYTLSASGASGSSKENDALNDDHDVGRAGLARRTPHHTPRRSPRSAKPPRSATMKTRDDELQPSTLQPKLPPHSALATRAQTNPRTQSCLPPQPFAAVYACTALAVDPFSVHDCPDLS